MNENTKKRAVALKYDSKNSEAPKVVGKGAGFVAEEILKRAKEHQIPIQEDPTLIELLGQLEINQTIPPELYEVVAEVFAFLYRIDRNL
ncbi:EscU/YscU/HrcU family type III secretion system export apparatus switch protein [Halalkalibacter urbisdiaboli]|uniref:EscU/YscU/HrcU family type III secretion system export apparatus switch protein n=1 Tax=Halalkalibacter urbisdiaboli TaxID=1960589 RepID=UPI000B43D471|nr:EscU/YscU/HrcU family type III secretion system export apparatus switch protein [Halalkalibacter urbisdiaboli]